MQSEAQEGPPRQRHALSFHAPGIDAKQDYLYRDSEIRDVSVIGLPDPTYGEELSRLLPWADRALQSSPRYVRLVAHFPMTITDKVQKFLMCEQSVLGMESS
jgi:hypothetical protein